MANLILSMSSAIIGDLHYASYPEEEKEYLRILRCAWEVMHLAIDIELKILILMIFPDPENWTTIND